MRSSRLKLIFLERNDWKHTIFALFMV
jgi:hypothetical protein